MRTRFAPSPTGYLHLGHAFAAFEAFDFAKRHGGECLLRIEDIDHTRCKDEFTTAIYEDLAWLGYDWPKPVHVQSAHISDYQQTLEHLKSRGLIYPCFLSRKEIKPLMENGVYLGPTSPLTEDEFKARIENGETPAWRLSLTRARDILDHDFERLEFEDTGVSVPQAPLGDEVLARKDIGLSYYLCVTHDDALQGITHIVRGVDIAPHTNFQVLLQKLMGWPTPAYHHHRLVLNADGVKLAKRKADTAIRAFRAAGLSPQEVLDLARGIG